MENKLSVIIPVFNDKERLEKLLSVLVYQKINLYPETEIIVIDDGSTDGLDLSQFGDSIKLIKHDINKGCAAARNTGLAAATGQYITFVDSDDMILDHYLHSIYTTMRSTNCQYCICNWKVNGRTAKTEMSFGDFPTEISVALWTYIFNRARLEMQQFNESLNVGSDIEFLKDQLSADMDYAIIETPIYDYNTLNENSLSHRFNRGEITREREEIKISSPKKNTTKKSLKKKKKRK